VPLEVVGGGKRGKKGGKDRSVEYAEIKETRKDRTNMRVGRNLSLSIWQERGRKGHGRGYGH